MILDIQRREDEFEDDFYVELTLGPTDPETVMEEKEMTKVSLSEANLFFLKKKKTYFVFEIRTSRQKDSRTHINVLDLTN